MVYRIFMALTAFASIGFALDASAQDIYHPELKSAIRAGVLLAGDTRADAGFGIELHYDLPVAEGGPGRLLLGPSVFAVFADENVTRNGCDVQESEQIVGIVGTMRYVLDIHPRVRPFGRLSLGAQYVDFDTDEEAGCLFDFNDFTETGPAIVLGIGLDIDVSDNVLVMVAADAHQGEEDFATLNVGVGWRF